jgi:hypothetical protein
MKTTCASSKFQRVLLSTLSIGILCASTVRSAQAGYVVTLHEVGSDVIATGSGPIDVSNLFLLLPDTGFASPIIVPDNAAIFTSRTNSPLLSFYVTARQLFTGPTSFGSGAVTFASAGSGDVAGIALSLGEIAVPRGYVSGQPLSDSATYSNQTFSSLGVTPGTYEWTWGKGANQNFTVQIGAATVPESGSTFALLLGAIAFLTVLCWKFKRHPLTIGV